MFVRRSNEKPGDAPREAAAVSEERIPEARTPAAVTGKKLLSKVKSPSKSIIDAGVIISGTVACTGGLEVIGQIQGDLHCATLMVGQQGHIRGDIFAENAHIDGRVDGTIRGKQIVLGTSAHVTGDIHHASLVIEHGAIFEGKVRRSSNPTQIEPAPQHRSSQPQPQAHQPPAPEGTTHHPESRREPGQMAPEGPGDIDNGQWPANRL